MKSSTYSVLIMLVFIRNIERAECKSIKQLIEVTDKLILKVGLEDTLSYMTKYNTVKELLKQGILETGSKSDNSAITISLSQSIRKYITTSFKDIVAME